MTPARVWRTSAVVVVAWLASVQGPSARSSAPISLNDVVRRVEAYVDSYGEQASIVVCTEHYEQHSQSSGSAAGARTLVSDFAIVRADTIRGWLGFRDVREVDSRKLADRDDRLAKVLMASEGRYDEARRLSDESARFNIGAIERNFNVPTTAFFFFTRENHGRFKFAARRVADDGTWEIGFKENSTPTLIRTPEGSSVRSSGTLWVQPDTGIVLRTVLTMEMISGRGNSIRRGTGQVDVTYRRVEDLKMWLPAAMDEQFEASQPLVLVRGGGGVPNAWDRVSGHAEYSEYRQFTTSVRIK